MSAKRAQSGNGPNGSLHIDDHDTTERTPLIPGPSVDGAVESLTSEATNHSPTANGKPRITNGSPSTKSELSMTRITVCVLAISLLILLQTTNITMMTTTQSIIARDLDAFESTSWFSSAYLIAVAALGPLNGKLSSVFSPRICVFVCTVILATGALISSAAASFQVFILGRAIQGVGASGVFVIAIILVLELTSPKRRGLAIGLLNTGYTTGVAIGATLAGALLEKTGWRALFYMQAPLALLGGTALLFAVPHNLNSSKEESSEPSPSTLTLLSRLDYFGAITLTTSIVLLLYALSSATSIPPWPIVASALVLVIFVLNELYLATDPVIPIALLKSCGLLLSCLGTTGYMIARWALLFYTPTWALAVRGWSPASAGSVLIPTNAGFAAGGLIVGWLHIRSTGSYYFATLAVYAVFPVTLVVLAALSTPTSSVALVILDVVICGAATGAALNYVLAHLLHLTPRNTHYVASSLLATFRGFGASFGSAVCGGVFSRALSTSLTQGFEKAGLEGREGLIRRLLGSPALVGELEGVERDIAVAGYEAALKRLFLSAGALAALMVVIQAGTGWKGVNGGEDEVRRDEEDGVREREEGIPDV